MQIFVYSFLGSAQNLTQAATIRALCVSGQERGAAGVSSSWGGGGWEWVGLFCLARASDSLGPVFFCGCVFFVVGDERPIAAGGWDAVGLGYARPWSPGKGLPAP